MTDEVSAAIASIEPQSDQSPNEEVKNFAVTNGNGISDIPVTEKNDVQWNVDDTVKSAPVSQPVAAPAVVADPGPGTMLLVFEGNPSGTNQPTIATINGAAFTAATNAQAAAKAAPKRTAPAPKAAGVVPSASPLNASLIKSTAATKAAAASPGASSTIGQGAFVKMIPVTAGSSVLVPSGTAAVKQGNVARPAGPAVIRPAPKANGVAAPPVQSTSNAVPKKPIPAAKPSIAGKPIVPAVAPKVAPSKTLNPVDRTIQHKKQLAETLLKLKKLEKHIVVGHPDHATPFTFSEIFQQTAVSFSKLASLTTHISLESVAPAEQRRWTPEMVNKFMGALGTFATSLKEIGDDLKKRHTEQITKNLKRKAEEEVANTKKPQAEPVAVIEAAPTLVEAVSGASTSSVPNSLSGQDDIGPNVNGIIEKLYHTSIPAVVVTDAAEENGERVIDAPVKEEPAEVAPPTAPESAPNQNDAKMDTEPAVPESKSTSTVMSSTDNAESQAAASAVDEAMEEMVAEPTSQEKEVPIQEAIEQEDIDMSEAVEEPTGISHEQQPISVTQ